MAWKPEVIFYPVFIAKEKLEEFAALIADLFPDDWMSRNPDKVTFVDDEEEI